MISFAIEEPGSPVPALYATLGVTKAFFSTNINISKNFKKSILNNISS